VHCRRTGSSWHNLAHALGVPRNILEAPITPNILKKLRKDKNIDVIKGLRMASQAYDGGSIPFHSLDVVLAQAASICSSSSASVMCVLCVYFCSTLVDSWPRSTDHLPLVCAASGRASACNVFYCVGAVSSWPGKTLLVPFSSAPARRPAILSAACLTGSAAR
jgi:hypothetical protein